MEIDDRVALLRTGWACKDTGLRGRLRLDKAESRILERDSAKEMGSVIDAGVGIGTGSPFTSDAMKSWSVR